VYQWCVKDSTTSNIICITTSNIICITNPYSAIIQGQQIGSLNLAQHDIALSAKAQTQIDAIIHSRDYNRPVI
jgi:hypothetical protein